MLLWHFISLKMHVALVNKLPRWSQHFFSFTTCVVIVIKRIPFITQITPPPTEGKKHTLQCKNRPWDLLIHLHIVRQNMPVFVRQYRLQRHNLFHQLNHDKVLKKKYNIFSKTNTIYYWETSSVCLPQTIRKLASQSSPYTPWWDFEDAKFS